MLLFDISFHNLIYFLRITFKITIWLCTVHLLSDNSTHFALGSVLQINLNFIFKLDVMFDTADSYVEGRRRVLSDMMRMN
jgi:hypothetical protein